MSWQVQEQNIFLTRYRTSRRFTACHCQRSRAAGFTKCHFKQQLNASLPDTTWLKQLHDLISEMLFPKSYLEEVIIIEE